MKTAVDHPGITLGQQPDDCSGCPGRKRLGWNWPATQNCRRRCWPTGTRWDDPMAARC